MSSGSRCWCCRRSSSPGSWHSRLSGDYIYFGAINAGMPIRSALIVVPVAGLLGGASGGAFSRILLAIATGDHVVTRWAKAWPIAVRAGLRD